MFQPPRDRDAYPSIRGYVYQIDLTVGRRLALRNGQVLELERGEDIDLVGQLISAPPGAAAETRRLEQVKHRDSGVTLRTPAALEAVANVHDHRANNPDIDIHFCFVTNAAVGRERLSPFPRNAAGIMPWEQVRTGQLVGPDAIAAAERLRAFLGAQSRPDGLDESVWTAWTAYLMAATAAEFGGFVARFQWSTGQPEAVQLPIVLRAAVRARGAPTPPRPTRLSTGSSSTSPACSRPPVRSGRQRPTWIACSPRRRCRTPTGSASRTSARP